MSKSKKVKLEAEDFCAMMPETDHEEEETAIDVSSLKEPMVAYLETCMDVIDVNQHDPDQLQHISRSIDADIQVLYNVINVANNLMAAARTRQTNAKQIADAIVARKQKGVSQ